MIDLRLANHRIMIGRVIRADASPGWRRIVTRGCGVTLRLYRLVGRFGVLVSTVER